MNYYTKFELYFGESKEKDTRRCRDDIQGLRLDDIHTFGVTEGVYENQKHHTRYGNFAFGVTEGLLKHKVRTCDKQYTPSDALKLAFLREEGGPRKWWKERAQLKILHKLKIE